MTGGEVPPLFTEEIGISRDGKIGGGCINGLLHFFERRYFFSWRSSSHSQKENHKKLLLTGELEVGEQKGVELQKRTNGQHKSLEPSSPSSSSSCSSAFSSADSYKTALPALPFLRQPASPRAPAKLPRRFSCDGVDTIDMLSRPKFNIKDLPRLSLGSREDTTTTFRLSALSSAVSSASPPARKTVPTDGPPPEPGSGKRSPNLVAKLMGLDPFSEEDPLPVGPTPKALLEMGPACREVRERPNVLREVENKLADLHFRNSSRNLRALKQIIETMQRRSGDRDMIVTSPKSSDGRNGKATSPRRIQHLRVRDVPEKCHGPPTGRARPISSPSPPRVEKTNGRRAPPVKPTKASPRPYVKRRLYNNPIEPDPNRTKYNSNVQSKVPLRPWHYKKITILPLAERDDTPKSKSKQGQKDESVRGMKLVEVGTASDIETVDQPSPVSVLDRVLYGDESSSSPQGMVPIGPLDNWEESSSDVLEVQCSHLEVGLEEDGDRRYVREILLASGLLHGDPDPDTEVVRLDPSLFRHLERVRQRGQVTTEMGRTSHRRLVFDVVGEIVTRKPSRTRHRVYGLGLEEHVKVVCAEMEGMRTRTADMEVCDEVARVMDVREDVSGVVLSIERLIFKDLVDEMVKGEGLGLGVHGRLCRRLF